MKTLSIIAALALECSLAPGFAGTASDAKPSTLPPPADFVIFNAKVLTVSSNFAVAQAIAVRDGRIVAVGKDSQIEPYEGPTTRLINAQDHVVMPGLYDAQVNSIAAAVSARNGLLPAMDSIAEVQDYIRDEADELPPGTWIVINWLYPTRLKEDRLPTKAELDAATTNNPVLWDFGPLAVVNSKALDISRITKATLNPINGEVLKDPKTLKPTGVLRNATSLLKLPRPQHPLTDEETRDALKQLYRQYNEQGITSIGDAQPGTNALYLWREMSRAGELTVRINCAREFDPGANSDDAIAKLDTLTNAPDGAVPYGPTGAGDDWVRIGPLKTALDGDMRMATTYLRTPYGTGPTYSITESAYRGVLKQDPFVLTEVLTEAANRGWQLSVHASGDAALDVALNCYEQINNKTNIAKRRFQLVHSDFQSMQSWVRCEKLGLGAIIQPAGLYEDGSSLITSVGTNRLDRYVAMRGWFERKLNVAASSEQQVQTDAPGSESDWSPWLGMWTTLTRTTSRGAVMTPEENLSREEAIRLYTINGARLNFEDRDKGSLEPGKLADLILLDNDPLKCPVEDVRKTRVLLTMVNGQIVWEARELMPFQSTPAIITAQPQPLIINVPNEAQPVAPTPLVVPAVTADTTKPADVGAKVPRGKGDIWPTETAKKATTVAATNEVTSMPETATAVADDESANALPTAAATTSPTNATLVITNSATVITVSNPSTSVTVTIQPTAPSVSNTVAAVISTNVDTTGATTAPATTEATPTATTDPQPVTTPATANPAASQNGASDPAKASVQPGLPDTSVTPPTPAVPAVPTPTVTPTPTPAPDAAVQTPATAPTVPTIATVPAAPVATDPNAQTAPVPVSPAAVTSQPVVAVPPTPAATITNISPLPAVPGPASAPVAAVPTAPVPATPASQAVDPTNWSHLISGAATNVLGH